jgi:hypothetical protein
MTNATLFKKFHEWLLKWRKTVNKPFGNEHFNLAEYYIWQMQYLLDTSSKTKHLDAWVKLKLVRKVRANFWKIVKEA